MDSYENIWSPRFLAYPVVHRMHCSKTGLGTAKNMARLSWLILVRQLGFFFPLYGNIPSGNLLHNYGKSIMIFNRKIHYKSAIFNSYVTNYQRVKSHVPVATSFHQFSTWSLFLLNFSTCCSNFSWKKGRETGDSMVVHRPVVWGFP